MLNSDVMMLVMLVSAHSAMVMRVQGQTAGAATTIPLIQWEPGCDTYSSTPGVRPSGISLYSQSVATTSECFALCTARTDCGGFTISTSSSSVSCLGYNINDELISTYLSPRWYWVRISYAWYSKSCPHDLGASDITCDNYNNQHDSKYINNWRITYAWNHPLTAADCHHWCTLHTGCRSVGYRYKNPPKNQGDCYLYYTTIPDLLRAGQQGDVINYSGGYTWTTYDRYCGEVPYVPPASGSVQCGRLAATLSLTIPTPMSHDHIIVYVGDTHLPDHCAFVFTSQEAARSDGRVEVTADYRKCGAHVDDEQRVVFDTSAVAALQQDDSQQMFSVYHFTCHVPITRTQLRTPVYSIVRGIIRKTSKASAGSKSVISEVDIDDVTDSTDVTFALDLLGVDAPIVVGAGLTLRATSDPHVPFRIYSCSMVSSSNDGIKVTLINSNGCASNDASTEVTSEHTDIRFIAKYMPLVTQIYFTCHVSTCVYDDCPQYDCDDVNSATSTEDHQ